MIGYHSISQGVSTHGYPLPFLNFILLIYMLFTCLHDTSQKASICSTERASEGLSNRILRMSPELSSTLARYPSPTLRNSKNIAVLSDCNFFGHCMTRCLTLSSSQRSHREYTLRSGPLRLQFRALHD